MDKVRDASGDVVLIGAETELGHGTQNMKTPVESIFPISSCAEKLGGLELQPDKNVAIEFSMIPGNPENCKNLIPCSNSFVENELRSNYFDISPTTPSRNCKESCFSSQSDQTMEEIFPIGCQTPSGNVFDPFAQGPEDLALAPKKKTLKKSHMPVCRQLNFDSCTSFMTLEEIDLQFDVAEDQLEEQLVQSVYELVLSDRLREISNEKVLVAMNYSENWKTPIISRYIKGVAETCPAAPPPCPRRSVVKYQNLGPSICRKLF